MLDNGYAVVPLALPVREYAGVFLENLRRARRGSTEYNPLLRTNALDATACGSLLDDLLASQIPGIVSDFLGGPLEFMHSRARLVLPGMQVHGLHQDWTEVSPERMVTVWVPLMHPPGSPGVQVIPGDRPPLSLVEGEHWTTDYDYPERLAQEHLGESLRPVPVKEGQALLLSSLNYHSTHVPKEQFRPRISAQIRFVRT
jgi:ectoine hydroxylase-related dioxygenase (phytanoyl-CoA dioxygenase family)